MSCEQRQDALQEYLEGTLGAEARAALEVHLPGCPACRRDLRLYRSVMEALPFLPEPRIPVDLSARVMSAVRTRHLAQRPQRELPAADLIRRLVWASLGGAFTIAMAGALGGWWGRIAAFAGRTISEDLVAAWATARDLWTMVAMLGDMAGVLWPVARQLGWVARRVGEPLAPYGPLILAAYAGALLISALLLTRALSRGERRLTHASS